jgi:hypothetical protein
MLTGVALAGSNGGIVGSNPIPLSLIFGIINGDRGCDEPTNVELELERLLGSNGGEKTDSPDCDKTLMAKAAMNKVVAKLNVVVFFIVFHLCSQIAALNK